MRGIFASCLILIMLMQVLSKTVVYASFLANQDYIAKNLCENRNAPEKKCCGKCQLKKKMESEQKQESPFSNSVKGLNEIIMLNESSAHDLSLFNYSENILFSPYKEMFVSVSGNAIFRPPCLA
ncbi:hypothetical protein BH09BAC5_BH09BAC5_00650 [soil metagenome]